MRKINFSETAVKNIKDLKLYLISKWSESIYDDFKTKLNKNINLIAKNPEAFPKSNKNIYKCVVIKSVSVFYRFNSTEIQILSVFDTRQNPTKINKIK